MPEESNSIAVVDSVIERYEKRLSVAKRLRDMLAQEPELVREILRDLAVLPKAATSARAESNSERQGGAPTNYTRVRDLMSARGNEWIATPELVSLTGINRGAVSNVLYTTHADKFESRPHPEKSRVRLWRLRSSGGEAEEQGGSSKG